MMQTNKNQAFQKMTHEEEYKVIRGDLLKVLALNAAYLVLLLALYFTNRNSHYLEHWFSKILHF